MNPFQIITLGVIGFLLTLCVVAMWRGWVTRREGVVWGSISAAAGTSIVWPQVTVVLARILGIGRGADLVLYCSVVVMLIGFLMIYVRLRRVRRELTLLVRHLALRDAVINTSDAPLQSASSDEDPEAAV